MRLSSPKAQRPNHGLLGTSLTRRPRGQPLGWRKMNRITVGLVLMVAITASCARLHPSDVPLPVKTPFDDDARAREAYLTGYETAYRRALTGDSSIGCFTKGPHGTAWELGQFSGLADGTEARVELEFHRLKEERERAD